MTSLTRLACAFVELAGKSKQDTAPRKLRLIPNANAGTTYRESWQIDSGEDEGAPPLRLVGAAC
jgi:hypothetical protein